MSLVVGGMRFEDQELSWEGWCSVQQVAEYQVRSFLKSSCLIPFVRCHIVPAVLIYLRVKIIIFKACPLHALHLSSPWSQKRCLALEVYFPCFLVMKTSTFVLCLHWGCPSGFSAGSSSTIFYTWPLLELKCNVVGGCNLVEKKKVVEYSLFFL